MLSELPQYSSYEPSGVPWLGSMPSHWRVLPNRILFEELKRRNYPSDELLSVTIGRGVVRQAALLANSSKKDSSNIDKSKYKLVLPGDITYNKMRAWQGALGLSRYRGIVSPAYVVIRARGSQNPAYFHYLLRTPAFAKEAERWSYGITSDQWSLRPEHFKMIYCCVPPPEEQSAIVRFLDHADRRIRRYIRAKQKLIKLLEEQKQAIIHQAVTRGLDPNVRMKPSGVEWIGEVPEHWLVRRVKTVCSCIVDCKNRTPDYVEGGGYVVVRTTNVRHGQFVLKGSYATDRVNYERWTQRGAPRVGDVFFTREAPAGEACLVPDREGICMGQRMMYFRPDPELLDARFLLCSIYGPLIRGYVEMACNGSTVGHLRLGQVSDVPVLWCPITEQRRLVTHIESLSEPLNQAIARAERECALMREFRSSLIADVVTGKLDVRAAAAALPDSDDPDDPADDSTIDEDAPEEDLLDPAIQEAAE